MNAVCNTHRRAVGVLCGLLLTWPLAAGAAATAGFHVAVKMASTSQGTCVSEPLNEAADFQVTCTSGQFVDILPMPLHAFVGTPGSQFRYLMMRGASNSARSARFPVSRDPPASVTAMRVSSGHERTDEPVEILVSF
jgi:hypothetical protein